VGQARGVGPAAGGAGLDAGRGEDAPGGGDPVVGGGQCDGGGFEPAGGRTGGDRGVLEDGLRPVRGPGGLLGVVPGSGGGRRGAAEGHRHRAQHGQGDSHPFMSNSGHHIGTVLWPATQRDQNRQ
jgi:hypothetical protein